MARRLTNSLKFLRLTFQHNRFETKRHASTYNAAVIKELDQPLVIEERKRAKLKANQVRIEVKYCSVNSVDCHKFRKQGTILPFVPGYEFSGEVIEVGKDLKKEQIALGEKVAALNLEEFGGLAQECILDINDIWRLPSQVSLKDAAVVAYGHSTALYAFSKLAKPNENEQIVISTGPAGLGLAAVDVAANIYKAKVIGVVDDENLGELVRQRGAFETEHFSPKLHKNILKHTGNKPVKVVYDAVGEHMMESIGSSVGNGGKVIHAAPFFYKTVPAPVPHSFVTIVSLKALRKQNLNLFRTVVSDTLELANEELIGAHVSATYSLSNINDAIKFIEEKKCTGKVLIQLED